jgi:hypothetical protein
MQNTCQGDRKKGHKGHKGPMGRLSPCNQNTKY